MAIKKIDNIDDNTVKSASKATYRPTANYIRLKKPPVFVAKETESQIGRALSRFEAPSVTLSDKQKGIIIRDLKKIVDKWDMGFSTTKAKLCRIYQLYIQIWLISKR